MTKYYRYFGFIFLIVLFITCIYSIIPKNPLSNSQITNIKENAETYLDEYLDISLSNFEANALSNENVSGQYILGKNIYNYDHDKNKVKYDGKSYRIKELVSDITLSSYYFHNEDIVLFRIEMPFLTFLSNDSYIINLNSSYTIIQTGLTYKINNNEYYINNLYHEESFLIINKPKLNTLNINNFPIRISALLKLNEHPDQVGYLVDFYALYEKKTIYTFGLNTFISSTGLTAESISNYLNIKKEN